MAWGSPARPLPAVFHCCGGGEQGDGCGSAGCSPMGLTCQQRCPAAVAVGPRHTLHLPRETLHPASA